MYTRTRRQDHGCGSRGARLALLPQALNTVAPCMHQPCMNPVHRSHDTPAYECNLA
jgi:hypothetical protein